MIQMKSSAGAFACIALVFAAGCSSKKDATKANFKDAINTYYSAHPECLWSTEVKFPTRADTSDTAKTAAYDALTDQGLLTRQQDSRKVFIFGSKEVSDYDLSDKGRAAWTADPQQPGSGNFCYGHREVSQIVSSTPPAQANGFVETQVTYTYVLKDVPVWAKGATVQAAFPAMAADIASCLRN